MTDSNIKIIYILNQRFPTEKAYGFQVAKMCEAFANIGINLELVVPFRVNSKKDIFKYYPIKNNFKFTKIFSPDFYWFQPLDKFAFWLKNIISAIFLGIYAVRSRAELIYSRDELPLYLLSFISDKKLVFEAHTFSNNRKKFYSRFKNKSIKIVAITGGIKSEFINYGYDPKNILVSHDGVDLDEFKNLMNSDEIKRNTGLPGNKPIILYAGQLYRHKGADVLAEAADYFREADFVFLGGRPEDLVVFKKKFGGFDNIFILGPRNRHEVLSFMSVADVLVLPNREESGHTSPLKLFEYMAAGKPIIASNISSIREILNKDNALIVKAAEPKLLAEAIKLLLSDQNLAETISNRAKEDIKKYTWQSRAETIRYFLNL